MKSLLKIICTTLTTMNSSFNLIIDICNYKLIKFTERFLFLSEDRFVWSTNSRQALIM